MALSTDKELAGLLKGVSRSFYLTLRVLPGRIRHQIGLAYLLARTTDTVADTGLVPLDQRLLALQALRERILGRSQASLRFSDLARHQGSPPERRLLEEVEAALAILERCEPEDRRRVAQVIETITSGQELDLRRFAAAAPGSVVALRTEAELDDYTWRVAGCVGEFWTRMCRAHLFPAATLNMDRLLADGVRFGKGLQLVNILRDLATDLGQGRCYLPSEQLERAGLQPADLQNPANEPRLRPCYNRYLDQARDHLLAGWSYTNTLPWRCARLRLACAWPILIGFETLSLLRTGNVLDPAERIKVSRAAVRRWLWRSVVLYPFPRAWRGMVAPAG